MGQRSQIYVIYKDNQNRDCISATYFQWNYGERMISRARYLMGWIKAQTVCIIICIQIIFLLLFIKSAMSQVLTLITKT